MAVTHGRKSFSLECFTFLSQSLPLVDRQLGDAVGEVAILSPLAVAGLPEVFAERRLGVRDLPLPRQLSCAVSIVERSRLCAVCVVESARGHQGPRATHLAGHTVAHAAHAARRRPEFRAAVRVVTGDAAVAVDGAGLADVSARAVGIG